MATNSPNPVDGDVQALIEHCECEIEKFKRCVAEYPDAPVLRSDLKLHEIALATLTTPPAQLLRPVGLPDKKQVCTDKFLSEYTPQQPHYRESFNKGWNAYLAEVQRLNATAHPVSDGWVKCSERMPPIGKRVLIPTSGLGEAIEAVRFESNKFNRFGIEVVADYWMPLPAAPGGQDD